jgi:hypothetical protein
MEATKDFRYVNRISLNVLSISAHLWLSYLLPLMDKKGIICQKGIIFLKITNALANKKAFLTIVQG